MKLEAVNSRMNMSPNIDGLPLKDVSLSTLMLIILTCNIQLISTCIRFKHYANCICWLLSAFGILQKKFILMLCLDIVS